MNAPAKTPTEPASPAQAPVLGRAPVTDRINVEPSILHGMTATEAQFIGLASVAVFVLIGGVVFVITGWWQVLLGLALFGPAVVLWFASSALARIKRDRPDAYYTQAISLWLTRHGLTSPRFITHQGYWSLGRPLGTDLSSPWEIGPEPPTPVSAPAQVARRTTEQPQKPTRGIPS